MYPNRESSRHRSFLLSSVLGGVVAVFLMTAAAQAQSPPAPTTSAPAPTPLPSSVQGSLDDLARVVLSYFPDRSGQVASSKDDTVDAVALDFADADGLAAGLLLSVYRPGAPLHHPVTGAVIGQREEAIGEIEIVSVGEGRLRGKWVGSAQTVRPGDGVRLPTRIPVVVSPGSEKADPLTRLLVSAMEETGRFQVGLRSPSTTWQQEGAAHYFIRLSVGDAPEAIRLQMQNTRSGQTVADLPMRLHLSEQDAILERWQYQRLRPSPTP